MRSSQPDEPANPYTDACAIVADHGGDAAAIEAARSDLVRRLARAGIPAADIPDDPGIRLLTAASALVHEPDPGKRRDALAALAAACDEAANWMLPTEQQGNYVVRLTTLVRAECTISTVAPNLRAAIRTALERASGHRMVGPEWEIDYDTELQPGDLTVAGVEPPAVGEEMEAGCCRLLTAAERAARDQIAADAGAA